MNIYLYFKKLISVSRIILIIKKLDDYIHWMKNRITSRRKILFHGHNEMNFNMIEPLYKKILLDSNTEVFFSFTNDINQKDRPKSRFNLEFTKQNIKQENILPIEKAKYIKWDAVIDSDLYTPWFYRNTKFIEIFHGIAAKAVTLEDGKVVNYNYHPNLKRYDICFFVNNIFFNKAKEANLWKNSDTGEIVGLCCLDDMVKKNNAETIAKIKDKFIPKEFKFRKIILYAPSWGSHNSFVRKGAEILKALAQMDIFAIIKPHPNFIMDEMKNIDGSLESFLNETFGNNNYILITDSPYEAALISDALISDFGSLALEYTLLRKPIFLFCGIDQKNHIADPDQFNRIFKCSIPFYETQSINKNTFEIQELSEENRIAMVEFENAYFANIGCATEAAFNALVRRNIICRKPPVSG
jgi:CDP-glycerol glycerophosphotransferase (TagB/SpsB family)